MRTKNITAYPSSLSFGEMTVSRTQEHDEHYEGGSWFRRKWFRIKFDYNVCGGVFRITGLNIGRRLAPAVLLVTDDPVRFQEAQIHSI